MTGVFTAAWASLHQAGWPAFPLPAGRKGPPPVGYTGRDGLDASYADLHAWADGPEGAGNVGVRMPAEVIGLDVDAYDGKTGAGALARLEASHGPLPDTWTSTSRDDGVSGIRFFRVPEGLRWPGEAGPGIEIIQRAHRYAVAAPSRHPDGRDYRWDSPNGRCDTPPRVADLPELPDSWVHGLTGGERDTAQPRSDLSPEQVQAWLADMPTGPACRRVANALTHETTALGGPGAAHDKARRAVGRLLRLGRQQHPGALAALGEYQQEWLAEVTRAGRNGQRRQPREAGSEFVRFLVWQIGKIDADPSDERCDCDATASGMPNAEPAPPSSAGPYFDKHGLLVATLARDIRAEVPLALTREGAVAVYQDGVYRIQKHALRAVCGEKLGDRHRPAHLNALEDLIEGQLWKEGRELPERPGEPLLNVGNGLLDLRTGELAPHDPSWLSVVQFPLVWDPAAVCPTYDRWVEETFTFTVEVDGEQCRVSQVEDLEECFSTMLDPTVTPTKAPYLYGPSRAGKSTMLRIAAAIAGPANVSAVSLHQLSQNRFAAANLYGKALNCAADMSGAHVEDLSVFKMMTGQDSIHADRKYGGQFTFTNVALFAFSANELVSVGESSRAYVERIKPFRCDNIIAGREDPSIETAMMSELPGILARWVRAWMRLRARGRYLPTHPVVLRELETAADRVRLWVEDRCHVHPAGPGESVPAHRMTGARGLHRAFNAWVEAQGGYKLQERRFRSRLLNVPGVCEIRSDRDGARGLNLAVKPDWDD